MATGVPANVWSAAAAIVDVGRLPTMKSPMAELFGQPHLAGDGLPMTASPLEFDRLRCFKAVSLT